MVVFSLITRNIFVENVFVPEFFFAVFYGHFDKVKLLKCYDVLLLTGVRQNIPSMVKTNWWISYNSKSEIDSTSSLKVVLNRRFFENLKTILIVLNVINNRE